MPEALSWVCGRTVAEKSRWRGWPKIGLGVVAEALQHALHSGLFKNSGNRVEAQIGFLQKAIISKIFLMEFLSLGSDL